MTNILVCSAGRRVKLIKDFKNTLGNSGKLIVANNSEFAPALYVADEKYLVHKITDENYINEILNICKIENINIVCTLIDPEIQILAQNLKKFEEKKILVMVPSEKTAKLCFDKYEMYKYAKANGLRTINTYGSIEEFKNSKNGKRFPVFVKPRTGSGSVGARKANDIETLEILFKQDSSLIIQDYMEGIDLDSDVYIDTINKKIINIFLKKKLESKIGGASKTVSFKDEKLNNFIKEIVSKFEFNGVINIDFFYKDGEYYLSEINPRFGGGYIHAYEEGVDFIKYLVNNANGIENVPEIGKYNENSIMMMYDDVIVIKNDDIIKNNL